jgi:GTP cyclohydrolase I
MDYAKHFAKMLNEYFPETEWDDTPLRTAQRFLAYLMEYGGPRKEMPFKFTTFPNKVSSPSMDRGNAKINQIIAVKGITFSSICQHHLLPYFGTAHVGYVPNRLMVGLSKIPRLVHWLAKAPTTQEALAEAIASEMKDRLECMGVAVILTAHHTCMGCRGVRAVGAEMTTSEMRGVFFAAAAAREEFMRLVLQ